jgi:plasmid stabilization system protein ParE
LDDLEAWIAERSTPRTAWNYIDRLVAAIEDLAAIPFVGTKREDLGEGFRTKGFEGRVTILFHVEGRDVIIVGIFYGGRRVVYP